MTNEHTPSFYLQEAYHLARELEQLPPEAATLQEWNDALDYLIHAPPEETAQAARERLLSALARP